MEEVRLKINGQERVFNYETTEVRLYRVVTDHPFNHVRTVEHGSQVVHLFDVPRILTYLTGTPIDGHGLDKKQLEQVCQDMDDKYGWNATMVISDFAPEDVKERYIRLATAPLKESVVVFPGEWCEA